MFVNHNEKTIYAYQWERMQVCNYLTYVKPRNETWSVHFLNGDEHIEDYFEGKAKIGV